MYVYKNLWQPLPLREKFNTYKVCFNWKAAVVCMAGIVSDQDFELARAAKESFDNHRYESCLSALNKLLDSRRQDGRVAHNRAVAQYLLSNLTHTDEFRKTLQAVSAQVTSSISVACSPIIPCAFSLIVMERVERWK